MAETSNKAPAKKAAAKKTTSSGKKRKMLSPDEKVAKLEAQLADVRAKAREKNDKAAEKLREERAKVQGKVDEGRKRVAEIDVELERLSPAGDPATADAAEDGLHGSDDVDTPDAQDD
jgi:hypothetical protein